MSAQQFKLPPEMQVHEKLPFSWKWSDEIREAELLNGENGDGQRYYRNYVPIPKLE